MQESFDKLNQNVLNNYDSILQSSYSFIISDKRNEASSVIKLAQKVQKKYIDSKHPNKQFGIIDLVLLKFKRFDLGYKPPDASAKASHSWSRRRKKSTMTLFINKFDPIYTPIRIIYKISPLIHDVVCIIHTRSPRRQKKPTASASMNKVNLLFYTPSIKSFVYLGCNAAFSSRNQLFTHLRVTTECTKQWARVVRLNLFAQLDKNKFILLSCTISLISFS